ncbi:hypothetical protein ACQ4LE_000183 [Meloidogyne hapla]|uniref:Uncharacterized protein n=1 Tax=Meloidogyne hapla TaxID=6305 RepID=A0A1I8BZX4_MELHA
MVISNTNKNIERLGFGIDRGGTFTDVFVVYPNGNCKTFKLLSEDPQNYIDAPTEAIRRILSEFTGKEIKKGELIDVKNIAWIRMGTTVATNALLERKGEPMALLITKGFKDLLYIGNQSRPKIFEFDIKIPSTLYSQVVEIDERVLIDHSSCQMNISGERIKASNGQPIIIEKPLDFDKIKQQLLSIYSKGIRSLAILFIHSYIYSAHEEAVGQLAKEIGFSNVSLSSKVIPMVKAVPRGFTTCSDAYLTPIIHKYIQGFRSGFLNNLEGVQVEFMQSDGGLCPVESFIGSRAILSGPAGGVVGVSFTAYEQENKEPVIGFDMGGTSTDVSRYDGRFVHVVDSVTAGIAIQAPQLEIKTVAAGGGSRLFFRDGLFVVGPESAGSNPGPVCYSKVGPLAVTDANVVLGRVLPEFFPKIFGPDEQQPLDKNASLKAFNALNDHVNAHMSAQGRPPISVQECALGFIRVANEAMCRPIRTLTEAKGFDTSRHILSCFGGAGGQHACAIARALGMSRVKVHKHAGVLSAYGLVLADVVNEQQESWIHKFDAENFPMLNERFKCLEVASLNELISQGFSPEQCKFERILNMGYEYSSYSLMCQPIGNAKGDDYSHFIEAFEEKFTREFGFTLPKRAIIAHDVRVRGIAKRFLLRSEQSQEWTNTAPPLKLVTNCYFEEGELDTNVYDLKELHFGHVIYGPAIIVDANCTILVEPNCRAEITSHGNVLIQLSSVSKDTIGTELDPIQLSIFSHRFMSIAEQMGTALQRSAFSVNIKDRLDFSCALFCHNGGLVANAPHIPVHLGGMQAAVRFQIKHVGAENFKRGDVYLSNHPKAGGSHLPDLTVITPVFISDESKTPDFFLANRGHHSDIGGLAPGSMPPHSTHLEQEGVVFISFKLVSEGHLNEQELKDILNAPCKIPGCSSARNIADNLADLNAQIAANHKGILLLKELISSYSLSVVRSYMSHIQQNAELAVRQLIKNVAVSIGGSSENKILRKVAEDKMDDGTPIKLALEINKETGDVLFDFTGTGLQVHNSCNTPSAVLMAAVIYCLRCLVGRDIPLNQGCLAPVKIRVPHGTILNPSDEAAVVGGNVLTSQRLCDVILHAFDAIAASQGCMNNLTFGDDSYGYYETIGGGAGAGNGFHGRSGIHSHMTNTRITDVEILERHYSAVIARKFHLRKGSGGAGRWHGGDGICRYLQFRKAVRLSLLTERRVFAPYGLNGGRPGKIGRNVLLRASDGVRDNLGAKISLNVNPGDILELETPGGGGYGRRRFWMEPPSNNLHYFGFRRRFSKETSAVIKNIESKLSEIENLLQNSQEITKCKELLDTIHKEIIKEAPSNSQLLEHLFNIEMAINRFSVAEGILCRLLFLKPSLAHKSMQKLLIDKVDEEDDAILDRIDQLLQENLKSENSLPSLLDFIENKKLQNLISGFKEPEDIKKLNFEKISEINNLLLDKEEKENIKNNSIEEMNKFCLFLNEGASMVEERQMHSLEFAVLAFFFLQYIQPFKEKTHATSQLLGDILSSLYSLPPTFSFNGINNLIQEAILYANVGDLRSLFRFFSNHMESFLLKLRVAYDF